MMKVKKMLEKWFRLAENKTTVRTEMIAVGARMPVWVLMLLFIIRFICLRNQ